MILLAIMFAASILLIKNKVTMKEVQMWLGHSSFSTTANIYAHIDVDSKLAQEWRRSWKRIGRKPFFKSISRKTRVT